MMQGYVLLGIAIINTVISQLLFKKGVLSLGDLNFSAGNLGLMVMNIFRNPFLLSGVFFYSISFILWLFVLGKIKLSIAYPITSLNFVLVIMASHYLFDEKLSILQYFSAGLIVLGVILLAK